MTTVWGTRMRGGRDIRVGFNTQSMWSLIVGDFRDLLLWDAQLRSVDPHKEVALHQGHPTGAFRNESRQLDTLCVRAGHLLLEPLITKP